MKPEALKELFIQSGALKEGHFRLSSGLHAGQYFQCALLLSDPARAEKLGKALAQAAKDFKPDIVVAPAMGGLIIGHETARALKIRSIFTERADGKMTLRRGFSLAKGERALIVEDVITTGKSTGEVIEVLKSYGAETVGAAAVVLRAPAAPNFGGAPTASIAHWPAVTWTEDQCPLCKEGKPIEKPGSRDFKKV